MVFSKSTETVGFNPFSKFSSIWIWRIVCCYIQETVTIKANNVIFWNYNCNTVHGAVTCFSLSFVWLHVKIYFYQPFALFLLIIALVTYSGMMVFGGQVFLVGRGQGTYAPPRSSIFHQFKSRPSCCLENRERNGRLHCFLWKWTLSFQSHLILITWTMFRTGTFIHFPSLPLQLWINIKSCWKIT